MEGTAVAKVAMAVAKAMVVEGMEATVCFSPTRVDHEINPIRFRIPTTGRLLIVYTLCLNRSAMRLLLSFSLFFHFLRVLGQIGTCTCILQCSERRLGSFLINMYSPSLYYSVCLRPIMPMCPTTGESFREEPPEDVINFAMEAKGPLFSLIKRRVKRLAAKISVHRHWFSVDR